MDLVSALTVAAAAYYSGEPTMTDAEFDAAQESLFDVDPDNDYFSVVGAEEPEGGGFLKVEHIQEMGSLRKATPGSNTLRNWLSKTSPDVGDFLLVVSDKLDGISISLKYLRGNFVQAVTRGDGKVGDDITDNVRKMRGCISNLHGHTFTGFIRGEIVLTKSSHALVPKYKNRRNAAAGISKRLTDTDICKALTVICYRADGFCTKQEEFSFLSSVGLIVPGWRTCTGAREVEDVLAEYSNGTRGGLDYDIDGLVVEYDALESRVGLGQSQGRPNGALACKFPSDSAVTTLKAIHWQVGASSVVIPVGEFSPVDVGGVTVSRASIGSTQAFLSLSLKEGATILVSRRNDVIPKIEKVISGGTTEFCVPVLCPSCENSLCRSGAHTICTHDNCHAQIVGKLRRWVVGIGVKNFGISLLTALVGEGMRDIPSLYLLEELYLADLELSGKRLGTKSAKKAMSGLLDRTELSLATFVGSLSIDMCGNTVCSTLCDAGIDTLDKMRAAKASDLSGIPGLGQARASSFVLGLEKNSHVIDSLLCNAGISILLPTKLSGKLDGICVCFSGTRDKVLEEKIKFAGGKVKATVNKNLTHLIVKDPQENTSKIKKAKSYGTEILTISEFYAKCLP